MKEAVRILGEAAEKAAKDEQRYLAASREPGKPAHEIRICKWRRLQSLRLKIRLRRAIKVLTEAAGRPELP